MAKKAAHTLSQWPLKTPFEAQYRAFKGPFKGRYNELGGPTESAVRECAAMVGAHDFSPRTGTKCAIGTLLSNIESLEPIDRSTDQSN